MSAFPLQAFPKMEVERRTARERITKPDFLNVELRIAPRAEFHFSERPLAVEQTWKPAPNFLGKAKDANPNSWRLLELTIPYSILLVPFILSYGPWIRVEGPSKLKDQLKDVTEAMAEKYQ
jgi:predicted DNA-binding transcriptional regulator YafY